VLDRIEGCLLEAPVLAYPDPALEYILGTDASDQNVGAVLSQVQTEVICWTAMASSSCRPGETHVPNPRGNSWIIVLTDHFTRWANALAIPDASAPTVARVLDQNVFCYFGLPEQIHSDQ